MPRTTNTAVQKQETQTVRITSARSFYRNHPKKVSIVPEHKDNLLSKEKECCSRATD